MDRKYIYEPIAAYRSHLKTDHNQNSEDYFLNLVKNSNINVEENKVTVKKIRKTEGTIAKISKALNSAKAKKGFAIFGIIVLIIALIFFIWEATEDPSTAIIKVELYVKILYIIAIAAIVVGLFVLIFKVLNKKIKEKSEKLTVQKEELRVHMNAAWTQMQALNDLYDWGMAAEITTKTVPIMELDPYFNIKRYEYMRDKYGLPEDLGPDSSIQFVQSGQIFGNPILVVNDLNHEIRDHTYTGTLTIHWTTTTRVNGKTVTQTRSQTLHASVTKPAPTYWMENVLYYCNDAAPDLKFSRTPSPANNMDEKEIKRYVDREGKKLQAAVRKNMGKKGAITLVNDLAFETLFNATDRNHDTQFRLLFTPLAREEMLEIIKDKTLGYGDDFAFIKNKQINTIFSKHLAATNLTCDPKLFVNYDVDDAKKVFVNYHNNYFRSFYFAMAPLLAIPLYQQHKPVEYIYKGFYDEKVCDWEHEAVVNYLDINKLKHELSSTKNILKTKVINSTKDLDVVEVEAKGYQTFNHVEYIPVFGGDGRTHLVPVPWIEYVPVSRTSTVNVKVTKDIKRPDFLNKTRNNDPFSSFVKDKIGDNSDFIFRRNMFAFINEHDFTVADDRKLDSLLAKETKEKKETE